MKLDLTKRTILKVGILALAVLIIAFGIFWPTTYYIQKINDQTSQLRAFLEEKYQQTLRSRVTRKRLTEIKSTLPDLQSHIFKKGNELQLITYLENLSAKHKLTQAINNSDLDKITNNKITIAMTLSGDYLNILNYTTDLESSIYFLNIEQFQITPVFTRNGDLTSQVSLNLTLGMYVSQ
ncbi:MAG: hypothetical protein WC526_00440 [Patescibacteria group bacterium]